MPREEFACDRCGERRGIHPTEEGLRCEKCLMNTFVADGGVAVRGDGAAGLEELAAEAVETLTTDDAVWVVVERAYGPADDAVEAWMADRPEYAIDRRVRGVEYVTYRVTGGAL